MYLNKEDLRLAFLRVLEGDTALSFVKILRGVADELDLSRKEEILHEGKARSLVPS
jgi:hypothetical protein